MTPCQVPLCSIGLTPNHPTLPKAHRTQEIRFLHLGQKTFIIMNNTKNADEMKALEVKIHKMLEERYKYDDIQTTKLSTPFGVVAEK